MNVLIPNQFPILRLGKLIQYILIDGSNFRQTFKQHIRQNLQIMKKYIVISIKIISTLVITGAIGLELWNIYATYNHIDIPNILHPVFWIERIAVISHVIEGIIAAYFAASRNKMPARYGIYTFFVGTVGLLELFNKYGIDKDGIDKDIIRKYLTKQI